MADPIMDLFEDTPLFNLDAIPDDSFSQGSSDPVEEALKLALGQVDAPIESEPTPDLPVNADLCVPAATATVPAQESIPVPAQPTAAVVTAQTVSLATLPTVAQAPAVVDTVPQVQAHATVSIASNTNVVSSSTVLLNSPLTVSSPSAAATTAAQQLAQIAQQLTPQQLAALTQQAGGKIVILKGPQGQAQVLQTVPGATSSTGGKVIRLVSGSPLKPGVLQGGAVLNQTTAGQTQVKVGAAGVQRLLQSPNGPVKQLLLTSMPQQGQQVQVQMQTQMTQAQVQVQPQSQPAQIQIQAQNQVQLQPAMQAQTPGSEAKRITLVLQQPSQAGAASSMGQTVVAQPQVTQVQGGQPQVQAPTRLVLGQLPGGKLVLQGSQLAALTQARAAGQAGGQPKVLTIQLQVQQQPNQQGGVKYQLVSGASGTGSPQVLQISQGQGGQRVAVPLKMLLQSQTSGAATAGGAVSVVKVVNASTAGPSSTTATATQAIRITKAPGDSSSVRRVEILCKQEKTSPEIGGTVTVVTSAKKKTSGGGSKKKSPVIAGTLSKSAGGADKKGKAKPAGGTLGDCGGTTIPAGGIKSKSKAKINTITLVGAKKRKRNPSSDHSDGELSPPSPAALEEDLIMKRRSNRVVNRKKYTEDLDIKITDDEDEQEDVDVTTTTPAVASISAAPAAAAHIHQGIDLHGDGLPGMQFFVENPSEEDAAIVDKILSMRVTKKEVSPGQYTNLEEFFVKYKNYSYLHCEWATMGQLEKDKRIHQKIKRFKTKHAQMRHFFHEEEEVFNPDYVEADRILDVSHSIDKDNGEPVIYYLVKWCSLPYEDATWELNEDVDEGKVEEFKKIQTRQPRLKKMARPQAGSWKKLEETREYKNGNTLREYQLEGVNWLLFNWYNRQNCILADEMGLGKTIQSITLLSEIYATGIQGPFLVIAPLSTITNWEREFSTWTDMNAIVYHGSLASRQMIQQYEMYSKDDKEHLIPGAYKFDALITTFEMVLSDCPELREISWRCVIIDEAHRLKNRNCKLLDSLKMLEMEHKVLLTGTPLQNTVEELFSLLHFLEPAQFPSEIEFLREFGDLKTEEQVQKLQAILKPMMLRRLKEDVEKNLAPKQETIIEVELTDIQKKYYRAILERNFSFLSLGANSNSNVPNLLNTMMELRKCCNHPYLINGAEEKIVAELRQVYDPLAPDFHLQALIRSAGKLVLLDKLLPRLKAGGHKVLIFSQMVRCLDILEDYLINKRYLYERIDGRVRGNLRQAAIDRFSKPDSDRFVFLLCTRAGGLGINLTAADTCVIFDSDWNPQNDLQAQARCHRIGQSKAVKVYRLITRNSYEREMLDKASLKLGLDRAVLQSMSGNKDSNVNGIQQFSKKEIEDLLRKGAYAAIMDENDEGSRFCEEDIDQILQRRATTITIESEGKGSTFSKASFVASENRNDIALDDPEFWEKWAKKADIDMDTLNRKNTLVIDTPRVRKQTRQYSTLRGEGAELTDADSDEEYPPVNSRHSRSARRADRHTGVGYGRTDCFRVEKHLLVYGWGRWRDILSHARCKRRLSERDVETICRVILVFCLLHYRGDENIKSFIWELITPPENGREPQTLLNHSGLSIPVPRGRKGKRVKAQSTFDVQKVEWIRKYNPDTLLLDDSYRKHLKHQCNKVLLRVRMLYYLKQEVIGEHAESVLKGADIRDVDIWMPEMEQQEVPTTWWDGEADRSLLAGVFKHGYEMYTTMRADPRLCFLERVGRPDDKAIDAEQHTADGELGDEADYDKYSEDPEFKPASRLPKDSYDESDGMKMEEDICVEDKAVAVITESVSNQNQSGCDWPSSSSLTARLRRLVTAYQRSYRQEQLKIEAEAKGDRRRRRCEQASKLKEIARQERQQRWTRREECDFYRVVSTFGVERMKKEPGVVEGQEPDYEWAQFRTFARLDKKTDESLSRYFRSFVAMCRRVCHLRPGREEDLSPLPQTVAPITEERASRTLYRISLLRRLRERVLPHPSLEERLLLAPRTSELPTWWSIPEHDRQLMLGTALHGVSRTEQSVFPDPQFTFTAARDEFIRNQQAAPPPQPQPVVHLNQPKSIAEVPVAKEDGREMDVSLLGGEVNAPLQSTPLTHHDGKARGQSWSFKKNKNKGASKGGEEGGSDSDSDSESGSSSSDRSGSSDDSGDSEEEAGGGAKTCDVDEENSLLSMALSQDGIPPADPIRVDWPKDRVLINRLDNLCTLVLTGQWPSGRRYVPETHINQSSELQGDEMAYARAGRKAIGVPGGEGEDGEFTVKLLKEEGLKLTFSKQALMPNGSGGESSRKRRKELELSDPDGFLDPLERIPRHRDPPTWLKENPEYEVEGDMLELLVNRSKRKRRRKADKALTGNEKVKLINIRTGKKIGAAFCPMLQDLREYLEENADLVVAPDWSETVRISGFLPETLFHRLLTEHSDIPKKTRHRRHHHHHHHHHHHQHHHTPEPPPENPYLEGVEEETLVSDGAYMMDEEDLETSQHFLTSSDFDVKIEAGDSLSQGDYDSSDQEALLDDVILAQKDSDSSSSSED
ncbi:chromodomain-helicase-DNA-binding protein 8 isoform X2 [Syngnathus typhle]|uniref:chromodomain-helicase-DNA-binding protein 8 isoform X2 n=1 Tax=Syngnathus typhle TaxID=161592 RepID=UPI002A6B1C86|nr:chromodomain-helicase-DNA-binding protein 8 isoform X2 [Syngnathus typhle]